MAGRGIWQSHTSVPPVGVLPHVLPDWALCLASRFSPPQPRPGPRSRGDSRQVTGGGIGAFPSFLLPPPSQASLVPAELPAERAVSHADAVRPLPHLAAPGATQPVPGTVRVTGRRHTGSRPHPSGASQLRGRGGPAEGPLAPPRKCANGDGDREGEPAAHRPRPFFVSARPPPRPRAHPHPHPLPAPTCTHTEVLLPTFLSPVHVPDSSWVAVAQRQAPHRLPEQSKALRTAGPPPIPASLLTLLVCFLSCVLESPRVTLKPAENLAFSKAQGLLVLITH